jgi:hypothetical protein
MDRDHPPTPSTHSASADVRRRVAALLACLAIGALVASAGIWLTGEPLWYVAIPATIAVGWLFFADPSECETPVRRRRGASSGNHWARHETESIDR